MHLVLVTALLAVCGADKLDRTYLPPASATTAGGSPGSLQTPFRTSNQGLGGLPKVGYSNDFEGVVVDAASPGTRASGAEETGLGGPRIAYGSTDSKVGDAAFTADVAFPRVGVQSGLKPAFAHQQVDSRPERVQASRDRISNIVKYENDVNPGSFNYAFETDNGIAAEENGVEVNGVRAQGGYSYTGDDGQVYSVTYTADADGYRPKGDHLPTPPPIPVEILKSLEKNAQDEAAGVIDDGSYDAQKYNTGEDYTKSDNGNGQYNGGQPTRLGNRPQSDPVASGSFINQNQGFFRPNSNQFASNPLFDSSNAPSNGNNAVSNSGRPTENSQIGFGLVSKNEYLPPSNIFNLNRRPALNNRPPGIQSDPQSGITIPTSTFNVNSGIDKNQNTEIPAFVPLGQQQLQEDRPKRPQANFPIFGKPTLIDSTLSIKDPFASGNKYTQNKQPNQKPQAIGGSFEVVSGNVYTSKNEYLPPRRQNNRPNQYNGNQRFQGTTATQSNQQFPGSQFLSPNSPSASAFASISRPVSGYQSSQQYNGKPTSSSQYSQYTGFSNKISQTPSSQVPLSSGFPTSSSFDGSPISQYRPSPFTPQSPTLQPQIELTTPLESNSDRNKSIAPNPVFDGPDSPSLMGSTNLPLFGSQQPNGIIGQYSFNANKIQQVSPTTSRLSDQSITPSSQNAAKPEGNLGPQSQLSNKLPFNGQYSFSTQRPSFEQYNQQQGSDDSYYYNTPSKPFNTPTPRPQGSVFPNSAFDQTYKVPQTPFGNRPQLSDTPETFFKPESKNPADSTRYPKPSSLGPISPTLPTKEDEQNKNTIHSQFNKVTQATTSSFPSAKPTASADFNRNQFGQFGTTPFQQINQLNKESQVFGKPGSSFAQATVVTSGPVRNQQLIGNTNPTTNQGLSTQFQQTQQYNGEVYEYKKPPQSLPTPQNSATSGQFGHTSQFGSPVTTSQVSQSQQFGANKPGSQFGSQFTQQSSTFGQRPQNSQVSQDSQSFNPNTQEQHQSKPGQFSSQPSNPNQNTQPIQGASKFPPVYNNQTPPCCKQVGVAPHSSQADEQDKAPQFGDQNGPKPDFSQKGSDQGTKPVQSVSSFAGVGEKFGGPRKPPSFDQTGYHY